MSENDWRPVNNIPEPPAEATPLAPVSIREEVKEAQVVQNSPNDTIIKVPEVGTFKGLPVRVAGDKIWLLKEGKRYWISSPEIYKKLGFSFGDERQIDAESLMLFQEGVPLK